MQPSKATTLALILVAASAITILYHVAQDDGNLVQGDQGKGAANAPSSALGEREVTFPPPVVSEPDTNATGAAISSGPPTTALPSLDHPFADLPRSRAGLALDDDPFGAKSQLDQEWLDRNGYPNTLQWYAYSGSSDEDLQRAADFGDSIARTMLDGRRLAQGEPAALADLLQQGANGSAFALELAASTFAGSGAHADPVMAYTLYRTLELRGNYSAALARESTVGGALDPIQRLEAEGNALELYNSLTAGRQNSAGLPCQVDPRPISL